MRYVLFLALLGAGCGWTNNNVRRTDSQASDEPPTKTAEAVATGEPARPSRALFVVGTMLQAVGSGAASAHREPLEERRKPLRLRCERSYRGDGSVDCKERP